MSSLPFIPILTFLSILQICTHQKKKKKFKEKGNIKILLTAHIKFCSPKSSEVLTRGKTKNQGLERWLSDSENIK